VNQNRLYLEIKYDDDKELNSVIQTLTDKDFNFKVTENKKKVNYSEIFKLVIKYKKIIGFPILIIFLLITIISGFKSLTSFVQNDSIPKELSVSYSCYSNNKFMLNNQVNNYNDKVSKITDIDRIRKIKDKFDADIKFFCDSEKKQ